MTGAKEERIRSAAYYHVGAGYFETVGLHVKRGRGFHDQDLKEGRTALVNGIAAKTFFGDQEPLGQVIRRGSTEYQVIGVAADVRGTSLEAQHSVVYLPLTDQKLARPPLQGITLMVRSHAGPETLAALRAEIASIDPRLLLFNLRSMDDFVAQVFYLVQVGVAVYGILGVFALALAAIGLAGVTAYAVARRRREIGIRVALGAGRADILRVVLREAIALTIAGTVLGLAGAWALARVLASVLHDVARTTEFSVNDPRLLVGAPMLLAALALAAAYLPARKSSKIDPLTALREE